MATTATYVEEQETIRLQIIDIKNNKNLSAEEKADHMQKVLMRQWSATHTTTMEKPVETTRTNFQPSYHNEELKQLGCQHYKRGCKLYAKCCDKWYPCRFCHDEVEDHLFDRYAVDQIVCMTCSTVQPIQETCINCHQCFGRYYCSCCKFFDDDPSKDIYHCDKCKICRIGKGIGIDYFHCDKCNACMSLSLKDHKCIERSLESNCPICSVYMFTSILPVMFLPCGHCMHVGCYEQYTLTNYICPLCSKSIADMSEYFRQIKKLLQKQKMPEEYEHQYAQIFCNDCEQKSIAKFHFIYHMCQYKSCESFNTRVLDHFTQDTVPEGLQEEENDNENDNDSENQEEESRSEESISEASTSIDEDIYEMANENSIGDEIIDSERIAIEQIRR